MIENNTNVNINNNDITLAGEWTATDFIVRFLYEFGTNSYGGLFMIQMLCISYAFGRCGK
eukprot:Pgem_evm1s16128